MADSWAVIGGGMLGGICALRLAQAGHRVTLFESQPQLGGLTAQCEFEGMHWDRFYHVMENADAALLELLQELNLSQEIVWNTTKTNFYDGENLYPLNNALDYLKLPALSAIDKLRIGLTIVRGSQIKTPDELEKIPLTQWLQKWSGDSGFRNLWLPLLRGKLGDNYKISSAAFIWSVIQRFYGARSGVKKTETFGYVTGGYARILDALSRSLSGYDVSVLTNQAVDSITAQNDELNIQYKSGEQKFDRAIMTVPSPLIVNMCSQMSAMEKAQHAKLNYQGVVCVSLLLRKPLGGAYLTYITDEEVPFTTVIEMTTLVDKNHYNGKHLVYLPKYVPADHALFEKNDQDIADYFIRGLREIFPNIEDSDVMTKVVSKARYVTTIPTINYRSHMPAVDTSMAGLHVCNSAQITNAALSVNESVQLANSTVAGLLANG